MKTLTIDVDAVRSVKNRHRFYTWLTMQSNGIIIVEMGTFNGSSARSWAYNETNLVLAYDISNTRSMLQQRSLSSNIVSAVRDCNQVSPEWFSKVDIIYLDVSHNGDDEALFLERIAPHFKGILVMDDIDSKKYYRKLYHVFNGLEREHHLLPKSIGERYGTGVVPYGDWTIEIKEES